MDPMIQIQEKYLLLKDELEDGLTRINMGLKDKRLNGMIENLYGAPVGAAQTKEEKIIIVIIINGMIENLYVKVQKFLQVFLFLLLFVFFDSFFRFDSFFFQCNF